MIPSRFPVKCTRIHTRLILRWTGGLLMALQLSASHADPAPARPVEGSIVLRVGPRTWTASEYRLWALAANEAAGNRSSELDEDSLRPLAQASLLADQAREHGLDHDPQVAARIRLAVDKVLAGAERDRLFAQATVTDEDIAKRLAAKPGAYDEFSLSHVFIACSSKAASQSGPARSRTEQAARAKAIQLRNQWAHGANFEELARRYSDDSASAHDGGRLPATLGLYLAGAFAPAVLDLAEGQVSQPVRGSEGYHLIQLNTRKRATLASRRAFIATLMREEAVDQQVADLLREHPPQLDRAALSATPAP